MNVRTALRQAVRLEYALVRMPLAVVDERIVRRYLSEDARPRRAFTLGLAALDAVAAQWIADPVAEPERPATREHAEREPADFETVASPSATSDVADEPVLADPEPDEVEHLAEELLEEEEIEPLAGELAENEELRRVQAELNAKRLLSEQHEH